MRNKDDMLFKDINYQRGKENGHKLVLCTTKILPMENAKIAPVLTPQMKSNSSFILCPVISSSFFNISNTSNPRIPPPSMDKTLTPKFGTGSAYPKIVKSSLKQADASPNCDFARALNATLIAPISKCKHRYKCLNF